MQSDQETNIPQMDAVVVGAGFAGIYMLKRLLDLGLSAKVFEAGGGVGGTWYWNRYPGARCDLESFDYSYSFSPELEQEWTWSERYPSQPELLRYINHVADRFQLRRHIQLDTRVISAAFDEADSRWTIATAGGESIKARYFIAASGVLSTPKPPELSGLDSFKGPWYHTGQWPHEEVDFTGQRVAVIGTGSSGVQSIPIIAQQAKHLTVFQRTPNYTVPSLNYPLDDAMQANVKKTYRKRREKSRASRFGIPAEFPTTSALEVSPEERSRAYNRAWDDSHLLAFRMTFSDILTSEEANETVAGFLRTKIGQIVRDATKAEKLTPRNFPFGTKRPCLGSTYYETYNRDNVDLVDLSKTPIVRVTPDGIDTTVSQYQFDSLVFATGFDALTGALMRIDIRGIGGRRLQQKWADGPKAYLGLLTSEFPNLFLITGPGSPGPLSNMLVSIEQHVEWVSDCVKYLADNHLTGIEATTEAEQTWMDHVQELVSGTLYLKANSWYVGANVPGKPRVFMPYIGGAGVYRAKCDEVANAGYRGCKLTAGPKSAESAAARQTASK